jgi:hypothetical protein
VSNTAFPVLLGTGGAQPGLVGILPGDGKPTAQRIFPAGPGRSIYRVALSADGTVAACADKGGTIRFFTGTFPVFAKHQVEFIQFGLPKEMAIIGLAFLTNDLLASADSAGNVVVWSISENRRVAQLPTKAQVFALRAPSPTTLAGILRRGNADVLVIWDMNDLREAWVGPSFKIPRHYVLASIDHSPSLNLLCHSDRAGGINLYDFSGKLAHRRIDAGQGDFYGTCFLGGLVYSGGYDSMTLKAHDPATGAEIAQRSLGGRILAVQRAGIDRLAVILEKGACEFVEAVTLRTLGTVPVPDVRCAAGPHEEYVIIAAERARTGTLVELGARVREALLAGDYAGAEAATDAMIAQGYPAEGFAARASCAAKAGRPVAELGALMALEQADPTAPLFPEAWRRMGELFAGLLEPDRALEAMRRYQTAVGTDSAVADAMARIETAAAAFNVSGEMVVLDCFPDVESTAPLFDLGILLGRLQTRPLVFAVREEGRLKEKDYQGEERFAAGLDLGDAGATEVVPVRYLGEDAAHSVVCLRPPPGQAGLAGVEVHLVFRKAMGEILVRRLLVFDPALFVGGSAIAMDAALANQTVHAALRNLAAGEALAAWLSKVESAVHRAVASVADDGY